MDKYYKFAIMNAILYVFNKNCSSKWKMIQKPPTPQKTLSVNARNCIFDTPEYLYVISILAKTLRYIRQMSFALFSILFETFWCSEESEP